MSKKTIDYNDAICYRPGILLGRVLHRLGEEHRGESRNQVARNLALLALAGFSIADYADLMRAAKALALVEARDSFGKACRLLSRQRATANNGEIVRTSVTKLVKRLDAIRQGGITSSDLANLDDLILIDV